MKIELSASIMPDSRLKSEIWKLMKKISKKYKTFHDIRKRFGAHLTVIGFENVDAKNLRKIVDEIESACKVTKPFVVRVHNIGYFTNEKQKFQTPYSIFLKVVKDEPLVKLNRILEKKIKKSGSLKSRYFRPHITLAHGDLTRENFYKAKKNLWNIKFSKKFTARYLKIMILKKGSRKWEYVRTIKLG
jgi:2'-5' RNA ligase